MKFGKRLLGEAARRWTHSYVDYKLLKSAIKLDVAAQDPRGPAFEAALRSELRKVAAFFVETEEELAGAWARLSQEAAAAAPAGAAGPSVATAASAAGNTPAQAQAQQAASAAAAKGLRELRGELQELRKFVALCYIAVVKAAKKRNRHLRAACGEGRVAPLRAVEVLSQQYFFTSPRLAALTTQAEILAQELAPRQPPASEVLAEYQCPICLDLLRSPVTLTCAHRFCWGCLLAQGTAVAQRGWGSSPGSGNSGSKDAKQQQQQQQQMEVDRTAVAGSSLAPQAQQQLAAQQAQQQQRRPGSPGSVLVPATWESPEQSEDEEQSQQRQQQSQQQSQQQQGGHQAAFAAAAPSPSLCTIDCAVCRKAQLLDLDRLQVDTHLDAFLQKLQAQRQQQRATSSSSSGRNGSSTITLLARASSSSLSMSLAIPAGGAAAAAAAAVAEGMAIDAKPLSRSAASLAEASELAEAEAAAAAAAAEAAAFGSAATAATSAAAVSQPAVAGLTALGKPPLLPPQRAEHAARLVVCLDLDGTLVTTFTPKRAPMLPPGSVSYTVGRGGRLNPGGVFVVERPGLGDFLRRIAPFSEVVLFTAGLEDYAAPICDEIEARYPGAFHHRLYRPATVAADVYPCIKDLSRLGRDLSRCVLVDDTPLAFFRQPNHGIPVLQFRGDIDDRMLPEAVAPLLESLHLAGSDVATPLARRFSMLKWFHSQGLAPPLPTSITAALQQHQGSALPPLKLQAQAQAFTPAPAPAVPASLAAHDASAAEVMSMHATVGTMLVCDFDRTLVDWDSGERLCDELAPELTSLLSSLQMPANFVPVTNTVLSEMHRRGVSRDGLVSCLREMGREMPLAAVRLLQWASRRGMEPVVLSDCNSVFITHILTGARVNTCVRAVLTNQASFERMPAAIPEAADEGEAEAAALAPACPAPRSSGWGFFRPSSAGNSSQAAAPATAASTAAAAPGKAVMSNTHRLVVHPRHDAAACGAHGCSLCPSNLCKGAELAALRAACPTPRRVIFCGDGANDLCPALLLGPQDLVLARAGFTLASLIAEREAAAVAAGMPASGAAGRAGSVAAGPRRVVAGVHLWSTHEELLRLVQQFAAC